MTQCVNQIGSRLPCRRDSLSPESASRYSYIGQIPGLSIDSIFKIAEKPVKMNCEQTNAGSINCRIAFNSSNFEVQCHFDKAKKFVCDNFKEVLSSLKTLTTDEISNTCSESEAPSSIDSYLKNIPPWLCVILQATLDKVNMAKKWTYEVVCVESRNAGYLPESKRCRCNR